MNSVNHNQREHSSQENVLKLTRITTLPFPSSKQIISISIITLFSLSVMMIIFDFNTMSKNIAFAQNTNNSLSSSTAATLNCTSLSAKISKKCGCTAKPQQRCL